MSGRPRVAWRTHDHTRGSLWLSLFILAVPVLVTSVAQALFQLADLTLVTRLGEHATTAVIVTNQSIRQIFFMFAMGASFGAQALISHFVGAGDAGRAEHVAGQVLVLGGGLSLAIALIGATAPEAVLRVMHVGPRVLEIGVPYVQITLLLSFGFVFGMLLGGILNGSGDAATPMWISVIQAVVALSAEWTLMFGHFGLPALGVKGTALGLAIGQVVGLTLALRVLFRGSSRVHLRLHHLRPDAAALRRILSLSWPPGLQMIGGFLVTAYFLRLVGDFGETAQAAYSIGLRLGMLGPMLAFPLAGACATLVGQNLGARNPRRAWQAIGVGLLAHASLLWSIAAALFFGRGAIMAAFANDPEVIRIGSEQLVYQAGSFVFLGIYFVAFRSLQGAGDVRVPMFISLGVSLCFSVPLGRYLALSSGLALGPTGIFAAGLISTGVSTTLTAGWLLTGRWSRRPGFAPPPAAEAGLEA